LQIIRLPTNHEYFDNFNKISSNFNRSSILNEIDSKGLCLTIGNFDGVHLGHQAIISRLKEIALQKNLASAIMTFEPHPLAFFNDNKKIDFRISTLKQKIQILQKYKIDYLILQNFNKKFSDLSANFFIKNILEKTLSIKYLLVGYDFTFGKNRQGNFKDLEGANFILEEVNPIKVKIDNQNLTCSSSLIRSLVKSGELKNANKILGHNFTIEGEVIHGKKLAQNLGFPTLNLNCKSQQIQPKFGVYKSFVKISDDSEKLLSITNFGVKPTIDNKESQPLFETHILNFNRDLYGKKIIVELEDFIREEKKFSSIENLKNQINLDITHLK
jgi:riboflavin kinase/FMN adenylyltransferase